MIIYIHGFGGSGEGMKARLFRQHYREGRFIAPSLSSIPELAISTLSELIEHFVKSEPVSLIGSSLGGFYALYLSDKYKLPAVLLNPSVTPYETLARLEGQAPSFYDGSSFEWNAGHLKMLKRFDGTVPEQSRLLLLLQSGDEVLDYREAVAKLPQAKTVIDEGGSHSFEAIEKHFSAIDAFFKAAHAG